MSGAGSLSLLSLEDPIGKPIPVVDVNSVGGLVRSLVAADTTGVRLIAGCRLNLMDGASLLVWPDRMNRIVWGCFFLTVVRNSTPSSPGMRMSLITIS